VLPRPVRGGRIDPETTRNVQPVSEATAARPPGRAAWLIDSADFWRLWFVGLVVFVVRWVETVAVGVFIYQQTGSPFIVAMMTMLRLLPMGLFGAFVGAMAERMERRTTLIIVIASMVVTSLTLGILAPARARSVAPRTRKLRQRRRLGDRQPGAARDDRRGCRRDTHGHRHGGRFGV
jgi:predicted branched-subunit amino acid permease